MRTEFVIEDLKQMLFGYRGLPFPQGDLSTVAKLVPNAGEVIDSIMRSKSPVIASRDFQLPADGLNHRNALGAVLFMPVSINGWQLPGEPYISMSSKKIIIETPLAGNTRRGSVKELINTGDYEIDIKGLIINHNADGYPFDEVGELRNLYELNVAVPITCALTDIFSVSRIVIKDITIPMMVGIQNAQAFELKCVSDEDFILIQ